MIAVVARAGPAADTAVTGPEYEAKTPAGRPDGEAVKMPAGAGLPATPRAVLGAAPFTGPGFTSAVANCPMPDPKSAVCAIPIGSLGW